MVAFSVNTLPSTRIRYRCVFKLFHFGECFQIVPYSVNTIPSFSAYPCGREVKTERFFFIFDEYASVWMGPQCECNTSSHLYQPYGHVITDDLSIMPNFKLRDLIAKGRNTENHAKLTGIKIYHFCVKLLTSIRRKLPGE